MKTPARHASQVSNRRAFDEASAQAVHHPKRDSYPDHRTASEVRATMPPPDSEIQGLLKTQENDLCSLRSTVDHLRNRLGPILMPVPTGAEANKTAPTGSEIGSNLQNHNERIESMISQVQNLINKLAI